MIKSFHKGPCELFLKTKKKSRSKFLPDEKTTSRSPRDRPSSCYQPRPSDSRELSRLGSRFSTVEDIKNGSISRPSSRNSVGAVSSNSSNESEKFQPSSSSKSSEKSKSRVYFCKDRNRVVIESDEFYISELCDLERDFEDEFFIECDPKELSLFYARNG